jgi:Ca2+-binding EF-hand superfamily protein
MDKSEDSLRTSKKLKVTQDEYLSTIEIKSIERDCLERVFKLLSELQEQPSSDEESVQKKYKRDIECKANEKKMKLNISNKFVSKTSQTTTKNKNFLEDERKYIAPKKKEEDKKEDTRTVGLKGIRKVLRTLCSEFPKEEMEMMIWEVDENLDGQVSHDELEIMYKRCVTDAMETEPKKLYYLIQFLMYDKERKGFITEEDTLEILYIRNEKNFNEAIDAIFE